VSSTHFAVFPARINAWRRQKEEKTKTRRRATSNIAFSRRSSVGLLTSRVAQVSGEVQPLTKSRRVA